MVVADFEKTQIILHEYDSLRAEIVQRSGYMFQLIEVAAVIGFGLIIIFTTDIKYRQKLLSKSTFGILFWSALSATIILFVIALFGFHRDIEKSAARIREIETHINSTYGEELLQWETRWGGAVTGYWGLGKKVRN